MRIQLFFITLGSLISVGCYAQNMFKEGVSKVKNEQFKIEYAGLDNDMIVIYNLKSKHAKGGPVSDNPLAAPLKREDFHFDRSAAYAIIQGIVKAKLENLRKNEDFVQVILTFEKSGKLTDIGYGLKKTTLVSLGEIAEIDARLRDSIVATFTGNTYKEYNFLIYSLGIIKFE
ncbi:hypothetical protein GZH53_17690 [Flavihumibacter sp. R14]|nr:hypothetical protein [Flavihumibacter soli]